MSSATQNSGRSRSNERQERRDSSRDRDQKNGKQKRKEKSQFSAASHSSGPERPWNNRHEYHYDNNWQNQYRPPPMMAMYADPRMPGPRMYDNDYQFSGPLYNDFGHDFGHNYRGYNRFPGYYPPRDGPRFGENVLEKAENMVNDIAEKRKQAEERNKKKKKKDGDRVRSSSLTRSEPTLSRSSGPESLRSKLTTETWERVSKNLPKPSVTAPVKETPVVKPSPKPDLSKITSKAESLTRASISKLINAPRSLKERQRLASLVKKTKPKTQRPKLTVQNVPEVSDTTPIEVNDILNLVELPDNLRQQVENLLENGPQDSGNRSPTKSPVAKKAKRDHVTIDETAKEMIVTDQPAKFVSINDDVAGDSDSVISDVTSAGQSDDERPFERLATRVTSDRKLNRILDSGSSTPTEENLLAEEKIDELVQQALGKSNHSDSVFKVPETPKSKSDCSEVTKAPTTQNQSSQASTQTHDSMVNSAKWNEGQNSAETSHSGDHRAPMITVDHSDSSHPLSIAARSLAMAKMKVRDMGDCLMSLHVSIHAPSQHEETVNLVLEITEKEEQWNAESTAVNAHYDLLKNMISETSQELERLSRLRETIKGDGEVLRKRRLEVLRNAVSKKKEVTSNAVTSTSELRDEDADRCSVDAESAQNTPRVDDVNHDVENIPESDVIPNSAECTPRNPQFVPNSTECTPRNSEHPPIETPRSAEDTPRTAESCPNYLSDNPHIAEDSPRSVEGQLRNDVEIISDEMTPDLTPRQESQSSEPTTTGEMQYLVSTAMSNSDGDDFYRHLQKHPPHNPKNSLLSLLERRMFDKLIRESDAQSEQSSDCFKIPDQPKSKSKAKKHNNRGLRKAKKLAKLKANKDSKSKKQQKSVVLLSYKELKPCGSMAKAVCQGKSEPSYSEKDDESCSNTVTDWNTESELDCPKMKAKLLKALDGPETKAKTKAEDRRSLLKKELMQSLDNKMNEEFDKKMDPLIRSKLHNHEIEATLQKYSKELDELQANIKRKGEQQKLTHRKEVTKSKEVPLLKEVSQRKELRKEKREPVIVLKKVDEGVTSSEVTSKESSPRRRTARRRHMRTPSDDTTNSDTNDELPLSVRGRKSGSRARETYSPDDLPSTRVRAEKSDSSSFPSDARKDRLRQIGVILSASELSDFCKDGHQLSDLESCTGSMIGTARTEDLNVQTPLDTVRTEELLVPLKTVQTPFDDSENYSSCLEFDDDMMLKSTAESFDYNIPESARSDDVVPMLQLAEKSENDSEVLETEKYENAMSKEPHSESLADSGLTDRTDDLSGQYEARIKEILNESTDAEITAITDVKSERDVMVIGESPSDLRYNEPGVSARSDTSSLPVIGHKKQRFLGHKSAVTSMVIHGRRMYTCSPQDCIIREFDLETAECLHVFKGQTENIYTMVALDFESKSFLYTGGYDNKMVKYDLDTRECLHTQILSAKIRCLIAKWDRVYTGLCSGEILALNPENEQCKSLVSSGKSVSCMDTGIEGSRNILVVGSFDPLISIHDAKNGLLLRTIRSHARVPLSVKAFHNHIYSAGADKCVKLHDLNSGDEIKSILLHQPVTDLVIVDSNIYVACFDGLIRCFSKDLELQRLYYGAGRNYLLRLGVNNNRLFSTNKCGDVESMPIVEDLYMCQIKNCRLGFGLIADLEFHVTEKHIDSRLERNVPVYFCSWIGCCFETGKRMDLENHLLNHMENLLTEAENQ